MCSRHIWSSDEMVHGFSGAKAPGGWDGYQLISVVLSADCGCPLSLVDGMDQNLSSCNAVVKRGWLGDGVPFDADTVKLRGYEFLDG